MSHLSSAAHPPASSQQPVLAGGFRVECWCWLVVVMGPSLGAQQGSELRGARTVIELADTIHITANNCKLNHRGNRIMRI